MYSISLESIGLLWNLNGSWKSSMNGSTTTFGPVAPCGLPVAAPEPDGAGLATAAAATITNKMFRTFFFDDWGENDWQWEKYEYRVTSTVSSISESYERHVSLDDLEITFLTFTVYRVYDTLGYLNFTFE